ncbi:MAG: P-II family nitrogen regulator [Dehalococcoidaceae bacterium]|nr:P-II family nitrogen regulator [Dehalococcoidaceae bacterium]
MKKVEAIIREEKLRAVIGGLEENGYFGLTITEVSGRGRQKGLTLQGRAREYKVDLLPKVKVEVVVMDSDVPLIINTIARLSRTGEIGDGKIFIIPVEDAVRIRTGEVGVNTI